MRTPSAIVQICAPPRPGLIVCQPQNFRTVQNRRFFRVDVDFPCCLQVLSISNPGSQNVVDDRARVRDISAGGARIVTSKRLEVGDLLLTRILPQQEVCKNRDGQTPAPRPTSKAVAPSPFAKSPQTTPLPSTPTVAALEIRGKVVRVAATPSETQPLFSIGVSFSSVSGRLEDRLVNLIFEIQRAQCNRQ